MSQIEAEIGGQEVFRSSFDKRDNFGRNLQPSQADVGSGQTIPNRESISRLHGGD